MKSRNKHKKRFRITAWYLNADRIYQLIGAAVLLQKAHILKANPGPAFAFSEKGIATAFIQEAVEEWLLEHGPMPLAKLINHNKLKPGCHFTLSHDFYCKKTNTPSIGKIHNKLRFAPNFHIEIPYSQKNFCSQTASHRLSGHSRLFVFGYIERISKTKIVARPYLIGDIHFDLDEREDAAWLTPADSNCIHVTQMDAFKKCIPEYEKNPPNLNVLKNIPEKTIKHHFAKIMKEAQIPKDWGGEKSDLFVPNLKVNGRFLPAAFLFKGPSKFKEMKIADLGKCGDQIDRLFSEPAELMVLQHCHAISPSVRNMMKAYAGQINNPKKYCIIDGYDTVRILKAYRMSGLKPLRTN